MMTLLKRRLWNPKRLSVNNKSVKESDPLKVVLVQTKDEILLEEPQVKQTAVEKEVNYVCEYV